MYTVKILGAPTPDQAQPNLLGTPVLPEPSLQVFTHASHTPTQGLCICSALCRGSFSSRFVHGCHLILPLRAFPQPPAWSDASLPPLHCFLLLSCLLPLGRLVCFSIFPYPPPWGSMVFQRSEGAAESSGSPSWPAARRLDCAVPTLSFMSFCSTMLRLNAGPTAGPVGPVGPG